MSTHLSLASRAEVPATASEVLTTLARVPIGSDAEEAWLLVEIMDARARRMPAGSRLRATLVRMVSLLAGALGRRHLRPAEPA